MEEKEKTLDELKEYRKQLSTLTEEEQKERDLYLKKLADGTLQGPPTGRSSLDKSWLQYYSDEAIMSDLPKMTALNYMKENNMNNLDGIALNFFGLKTTYKELFNKIDETTKALVQIGVKKDDVVVINSVTLPQTVFLLYALNKIGAIANLTDLRTDANGMKHYFNEGKSKFVFTLDASYKGFESVLNETSIEKIVLLNPTDTVPFVGKIASNMKENKELSKEQIANKKLEQKNIQQIIANNSKITDWKTFIKNGKKCNNVVEAGYEEDKALAIVHTSGTTSMPKSVVLTNDNFNAMALQYNVSDFEYSKGESLLNIIPIFVAYGVVNSLHMPLCLGMTNIVYPKVVNDDFPDIIMKYKPNHVIAIPMHWKFLLENKLDKVKDLSFLKTAACGGDKLNIELEKQLNEFLSEHNAPGNIVKGYGMTEVAACAVTNTNNTSKIGSVGIPMVKNNIAIIDPDTGIEVTSGEKGEICIQTPTAMKEYFNNPEETNETMRKHDDGKMWIHSGDEGHFEKDANLDVDGRYKRLIIRRGFKVSAKSIEDVIMKNNKVQECVVVKAPHEEDGEIPFVYLVIKDEYLEQKNNIYEEIKNACIESLPDYYIPNEFANIEKLPYTKNSKLDINLLEKKAKEILEINKENLEVKTR